MYPENKANSANRGEAEYLVAAEAGHQHGFDSLAFLGLSYRAVKLLWSALSLAAALGVAQAGRAQTPNGSAYYEDSIKGARTIESLGSDLFGDTTSLQDGATTFRQTDISVRLNSKIPMSLGRKYKYGGGYQQSIVVVPEQGTEVFGRGWMLDVPYMTGTYDTRDGWVAIVKGADEFGGPWTQLGGRCTSGTFAPLRKLGPWPYYHTTYIAAYNYWSGTSINVPGYGEEQLLVKSAQSISPSDGKTYYGTTRSNWQVSCTPTIKNGPGEGFVVTMQDGVTYYFDWMVSRKAIDLTDGQYGDWHLIVPRSEIFLYATKAVDRFGNSVTYAYDTASPQRLLSIQSSDGAYISLTYNSNGKIATATTASGTWSYSYTPNSSGLILLSAVQLPDQSKWTFAEPLRLGASMDVTLFGLFCSVQNRRSLTTDVAPLPQDQGTLVMTHPSGAVGTFEFRHLAHGTNRTPGACSTVLLPQSSDVVTVQTGIPDTYLKESLVRKTISGPAISPQTWTFRYYPNWSYDNECPNGCPSTSETAITRPDGTIRRLIFGNDYPTNSGFLYSELIQEAGVVVRRTDNAFLSSAAGQPFPDVVGEEPYTRNNRVSRLNRPVVATTTTQDATTFSRQVNGFDALVRPTSVTKSSSLGFSRTESFEFQDDLLHWVIGLQKSTSVSGIGEISRTTFNAMGLPSESYGQNGLLNSTFTYWASGSLRTVSDGKGNTTTFDSWKRGIPQLVQFADGTTQTALVNDVGWITKVTDQLSNETNYGYDAMGRLASINYPAGDTAVWNPLSVEFRPLIATDSIPPGFAAGQWRERITQGNYTKVTYMDSMWRPVLVHEYDSSNAPATLRSEKMSYDNMGLLSFKSYPTADAIPPSQGTRTFYDALGRVKRTEQDSELNPSVLVTTTEYLPGFKIRTTNPRGFQTTTQYQAFDTPDYSSPVRIDAPAGVTSAILRDGVGRPLQMTRSGPGG
jgi:YD repeat-containing protein